MRILNITLVVIATFFTTLAQLAFKIGASIQGISLGPVPINSIILVGFLSYVIAGFLFIYALRGGELSILYPLWALSFVWIFIASFLILRESINFFNWLGIFFIILGISLVGRGAKNG
jgi:undecaprenyl phosphate-alpha-L-ara4N flippase subunit ArnE